MTTLERFEKYVLPEPNSGCWLWTGSYFHGGYGRFSETHKTSVLAHRFSFKTYRGTIPTGMFVCHRCDNPACVNPDHLFLGSPKDNNRDMVSKGRQAKGEKIRKLKLTEEQARQIRIETSTSVAEFAKRFNVSYGVVWGVRAGASYAWAA